MSALDANRQRSAFTDALRPPAGYVLGACIGTTYSLDFDVFTAVLLAFVGADLEDPLNDAPSVLTTVARLRSRLRVHVNEASLGPPASINRLFALYDRILRPNTMEGGVFHPKVWALRFDPVTHSRRHSVDPVYRLLTASRNVKDSGCWELGALFEGTRRASTQKFGFEVSAFCRRVASSRDLPRALWKLIEELKHVEFKSPREAVDGLRFDWQWPGERPLFNRLPQTLSRTLVISPFVRADFLKRICHRTDQLILVSTQDELDRLSDEAHAQLAEARVFVVSGGADEDGSLLDLHAKLLAWESENESETLIGSANATGPGWGCGSTMNCEAMVSLKPGLGIDAVMKAFVSPEKDQLRPWIEEYVRQPEVFDPEKEITKQLEGFKCLLRADQIRGEYDSGKKTLRLRARPSGGVRAWRAGMCAEIIPLLQRDQARMDYRLVYDSGAVFAGIELEDVAAFAYIVISNEHHKDIDLAFVVQFELDLGTLHADERDNAVNARILEGVDARSLLLNVLAGLPGGISHSTGDRDSGNGQAGEQLLRRVTIERILEACTADPSRIDEVDVVLAACGDLQNMSAFRNFWAVFRESLEEESARV